MGNQSALCKMYLELLHERETIRSDIQKNDDEINSINRYLEVILTDENKELSMFSPRNSLHLMNDKIQEQQNRLEVLEEANRSCYREVNKLDDRIEELQLILKKEGYSIDPDVLRETLEDPPSDSVTVSNRIVDSLSRNSEDVGSDENSFGSSDWVKQLLCVVDHRRKKMSDRISNFSVDNLEHCLHSLDLCNRYWNVDPIRAKMELDKVVKTIHLSIDSLNDLIRDLQQVDFDQTNFVDSLILYANELQTCYNVSISISVDPSFESSWYAKMIHVKHFAQHVLMEGLKECIHNSIEISRCSDISIKMNKVHDSVELVIKDNGKVTWDDDVCYGVDHSFALLDAIGEYKYDNGMVIRMMIPCRG